MSQPIFPNPPTAFHKNPRQPNSLSRVVCHFCLKIAQKPLKNLPGLRPGPAESTHLWTSTPSVWTPRRGPEGVSGVARTPDPDDATKRGKFSKAVMSGGTAGAKRTHISHDFMKRSSTANYPLKISANAALPRKRSSSAHSLTLKPRHSRRKKFGRDRAQVTECTNTPCLVNVTSP